MTTPRWHIKNILQILTLTGYKIIITSNTPAHLYMRWSNETWRLHLRTGIVRGLTKLFIPYYCFTVYEDNEQEEAGDTLEHTFIKEPWAGCETRYFYFWGTIGGEPSPSNTCCFIKHRPLGLLFVENYNLEEWLPVGPLFTEEYTIDYPPDFTLLFTEAYTWKIN